MSDGESWVVATGSAIVTDAGLLLVPTGPPSDGRPWELSRNPSTGWLEASAPPDASADDPTALRLEGDSLPTDGARVKAFGSLRGRVMQVVSWCAEPLETSSWAAGRWEAGVAPEVAEEVTASLIEQDFLIDGVGTARTECGGDVVTIDVDRLTPEIMRWIATQPAGSVIPFPFLTAL